MPQVEKNVLEITSTLDKSGGASSISTVFYVSAICLNKYSLARAVGHVSGPIRVKLSKSGYHSKVFSFICSSRSAMKRNTFQDTNVTTSLEYGNLDKKCLHLRLSRFICWDKCDQLAKIKEGR